MSEKNDFIQLPPIKKDTPSEVVSMIWQYLKLPEESRKRVKADLIDVHENCGKEDFKIPDLYDIVPKEEIAEFEDIMRKPPGCMCRNMRNTKLWMKCCKNGKGQASLLLSWIPGSKN